MKTILAIETSCDDTCCSVVQVRGGKNPKFNVLSNIVSSQTAIHKKYGGVYPTLAKREHQRNLPLVFKEALRKAGLPKFQLSHLTSQSRTSNVKSFLGQEQKLKIDLIALTVGPGLEPCLWVGVNFAKDLAKQWSLPIIPVNHIEAHIAANWLVPVARNPKSEIKNPKQIQNSNNKNSKQIKFPAICLVVSGGHTQLILMRKIGNYKILGETRDDAAGECFDKTARLLGLGYPGGPAIAALADTAAKLKLKSTKLKINLPRPMLYSKDYDFSFSGLKTAVLYDFKSRQAKTRKSKSYISLMAAEIQQAIIDVLLTKTLRLAKEYDAKTIMLGGGVAANDQLRKQFISKLQASALKLNFLVPPKNLCTDNAAMVAVAGYFNWLAGKKLAWPEIKAVANLRLDQD